jgi:hypothetical protein
MAVMCDDAHWVNRAGAAIVALQGVAAIIEFGRRRRLQKVTASLVRNESAASLESPASDRDPKLQVKRAAIVAAETDRAERTAFDVVVGLAVLGELLHGFGDLLLHAFH